MATLLRHRPGAVWDSELDYILGCFSQIAYVPTPFDIDDGRYSKVVPSQAFQDALGNAAVIDIQRVLGRLFGPEFEPAVRQVVTANSVTTIVRVRQVVVCALRGTVPVHQRWRPHSDLAIDAKAIRAPRSFRLNENHRYHMGFLTEAERILPMLRERCAEVGGGDMLYFTGHSLGGALAGVLDRLWEVDRPADVRATVVFGCPRFGNAPAVASRPIRAVVREGDPIPGVPSVWMGYADAKPVTIESPDGRAHFPKRILNHLMEGYQRALAWRADRLSEDADFYDELEAALVDP